MPIFRRAGQAPADMEYGMAEDSDRSKGRIFADLVALHQSMASDVPVEQLELADKTSTPPGNYLERKSRTK